MQPSALASTSEALQHSQSALNYLARAVRHGQEIDQSFPTPSEEFQTPPWEHSDPKPRPVVQAAACTDGVTAHQKHLEDDTCLSVSAEYSLALINENFKHFVQSIKLQCLELPSTLTKRQKQKILKMLHNEQFKGQKARIKKMRRDIQKHKRGKGGNGKPNTVIQPSTATEVEALPLDDSNVGNKMLRSMGWSQGTGLGLLAQGQVEPVPVVKRLKRRGLGA